MFSLSQYRYNNVWIIGNTLIIDFCLYFSLGVLRYISESTEELLWDNKRIKWSDYFDTVVYDSSDDYFDDDYY